MTDPSSPAKLQPDHIQERRDNVHTLPVFDRPAMIKPDHVVINPLDPERIWKFEKEDDTPLGRAYYTGKLASGRRSYTPEDRYGAGVMYRSIYESVHGSDCATSNMERVGGSQNGGRSSPKLCIARDLRKRIVAEMAADNFYIVEQFCGEGAHASDAVRAIYAGFEKSVSQAVCVALDDLLDAIIALGLPRGAHG